MWYLPLFVFLINTSVGIAIPSQTYLQEATPGGLRGRVFGNFWFVSTVSSMIPVILSGTATEFFGIRFLVFMLFTVSAAIYYYSKKSGRGLISNFSVKESN